MTKIFTNFCQNVGGYKILHMRSLWLSFLSSIFVFSSVSFADPNIASNTNSATCNDSTLETYSGTSNLSANWGANTINLHWYADENATTELTGSGIPTSCVYDGALTPPPVASIPQKTGYTFAGWKVRGLPDEYTRLQYVESTGTQYIDTGVSGFNSGDWEIGVKWMITGWSVSYGYVLGVYKNEASNAYRVILQNTDNDAYWISANSKAGGGSVAVTNKPKNVIHTATLMKNTFVFDGQTYSAPTTGDTIPSSAKMTLFGGGGSNVLKSKSRIYSAYAKKNNVLKFNLIPARRNSDSVVGMYDTVTKTFLTNVGTGVFTGPVAQ